MLTHSKTNPTINANPNNTSTPPPLVKFELDTFLAFFERVYLDKQHKLAFIQNIKKYKVRSIDGKIEALLEIEQLTEFEATYLSEFNPIEYYPRHILEFIQLLITEHKSLKEPSASVVKLLKQFLTDTILLSTNHSDFDKNLTSYIGLLINDSENNNELVLKLEALKKLSKAEILFTSNRGKFLNDYEVITKGDYFSCPMHLKAYNHVISTNGKPSSTLPPAQELKLMVEVVDKIHSLALKNIEKTKKNKHHSKVMGPQTPSKSRSLIKLESKYIDKVLSLLLNEIKTHDDIKNIREYNLIEQFLVEHLKLNQRMDGTPLVPFDTSLERLIRDLTAPYWTTSKLALDLKAIRKEFQPAVKEESIQDKRAPENIESSKKALALKTQKAAIQLKLKEMADLNQIRVKEYAKNCIPQKGQKLTDEEIQALTQQKKEWKKKHYPLYVIDTETLNEICKKQEKQFRQFKQRKLKFEPISEIQNKDVLKYKDKDGQTITQILEKPKTRIDLILCSPPQPIIFNKFSTELDVALRDNSPVGELKATISSWFKKLTS